MLRKLKYIILIIIILIMSVKTYSLAFDFLPYIEKKEILNNEINISLKLSDLEEYDEGLNVVSGKLVYDHNIFEEATFNGNNGWTCAYNNDESTGNEGKFVLITTAGNATKDTEIAQIVLKLKENIKDINTGITIESIESSYDSEKIETQDKKINLEISNETIRISNATNNKTEEKEISKNNDVKKEKKVEKNNYIVYIFIGIIVIVTILFLIFIIKINKKEVIK